MGGRSVARIPVGAAFNLPVYHCSCAGRLAARLCVSLNSDYINFSSPSGGATMTNERDVEKGYSLTEYVAKLRRLADSLENGEKFEIQIAGERIYVPVRAEFNIEHEREGISEEIEFQIKWNNE